MYREKENTMTLEEVVAKFTFKQMTASNTVGEDQIVVRFSNESEYYVSFGKPVWELGQAPSSWRNLGVCQSVEDVEKCIATLSFSSLYDPNGWSIDKGTNDNLSPQNQTS